MEEDNEEQSPRENIVGSYYEEDHLRREEQEKVAELRRFEEAIKKDDRQIPERNRSAKRKPVLELGRGRFSADYTPTVKRRR
ncbi:hypothetical protein Tco_0883802 [Tanacetum coccineum]